MSKLFPKFLLISLLPLMFLSFASTALAATVRCDCGESGGGIFSCDGSCSSTNCPNATMYPGRTCRPITPAEETAKVNKGLQEAKEASLTAVPPVLGIKIGGFSFPATVTLDCSKTVTDASGNKTNLCAIPWIGEYVAVIFKYGVGLAAILAVVMIMIGGFIWLTSGGSPDKVGKAKEFITSSLIGLVLALFSYAMLYAINPRLVASEPILVQKVTPLNFMCCKDATGKYAMAGGSANKCPSGSDSVASSYCIPAENQNCDPPNTIIPYGDETSLDAPGVGSKCTEVCKAKGGIRFLQTMQAADGQGLQQSCCVCNADSNCIIEGGGACNTTSACCPTLTCNTRDHECHRSLHGALCNVDTDCGPGLVCFDTGGKLEFSYNQCCRRISNNMPGFRCGENSDCESGICNGCGLTKDARCTETTSKDDIACSGATQRAPCN